MGKLVRDSLGIEPHRLIQLDDSAYERALRDKVIEEATEVFDAETDSDIVEEIGDLLEVLVTLMAFKKIDMDEVQASQDLKRITKGGFAGRNYLLTVE